MALCPHCSIRANRNIYPNLYPVNNPFRYPITLPQIKSKVYEEFGLPGGFNTVTEDEIGPYWRSVTTVLYPSDWKSSANQLQYGAGNRNGYGLGYPNTGHCSCYNKCFLQPLPYSNLPRPYPAPPRFPHKQGFYF